MARSRSSSRSSSSSRSAPSRSSAPVKSAPPQNAVQTQQPKQPGLFAQMATTAAGVAVGSAVGHTLAAGVGSLFGGGRDREPQTVQEPQQYASQGQAQQPNSSCDVDQKVDKTTFYLS